MPPTQAQYAEQQYAEQQYAGQQYASPQDKSMFTLSNAMLLVFVLFVLWHLVVKPAASWFYTKENEVAIITASASTSLDDQAKMAAMAMSAAESKTEASAEVAGNTGTSTAAAVVTVDDSDINGAASPVINESDVQCGVYSTEKKWANNKAYRVFGGHKYCFEDGVKVDQENPPSWCKSVSRDSCINTCQADPNCNRALWRTSGHTCYLMDGDSATVDKNGVVDDNYITRPCR
jgi:hypothetical protein